MFSTTNPLVNHICMVLVLGGGTNDGSERVFGLLHTCASILDGRDFKSCVLDLQVNIFVDKEKNKMSSCKPHHCK